MSWKPSRCWNCGIIKSCSISWYPCPLSLDYICRFIFKTIRSIYKSICKTTPYCHISRMQSLFLHNVMVFYKPNWIDLSVNFIIEAKMAFIKAEYIPLPSEVNEKCYENGKFHGPLIPRSAIDAFAWFCRYRKA